MDTNLRGYVNLCVEACHGEPPSCHWSSASGDINYLTCHVALQNHVIEGSSNFMSGSSSWYMTTLASLVTIGI